MDAAGGFVNPGALVSDAALVSAGCWAVACADCRDGFVNPGALVSDAALVNAGCWAVACADCRDVCMGLVSPDAFCNRPVSPKVGALVSAEP